MMGIGVYLCLKVMYSFSNMYEVPNTCNLVFAGTQMNNTVSVLQKAVK